MGIVTNAGGFNLTLHGIRSLDNLLEVGVLTVGAPDECLYAGIATGGTYSTADLQGKWHAVQFLTKNAGWRKNEFSVDASGNLSEDTFLREDGTGNFGPTPSSIGVMSVNSFGEVAVTAWPTFHGAMSADKKLIIGTGTAGTASDQFRFEVWMK
jgi:hypothetical protein